MLCLADMENWARSLAGTLCGFQDHMCTNMQKRAWLTVAVVVVAVGSGQSHSSQQQQQQQQSK